MKSAYLFRISSAILIVCAAFSAFINPALAARSKTRERPPAEVFAYGLKVVPSKEEIVVQPGEETKFAITATNLIAGDMDISLSAWSFARDNRGNTFRIPKKDEKKFRGAASWLRFKRAGIRLRAKSDTPLEITIKTPKDAAPGTHSAYIAIVGMPLAEKNQPIKTRFTINALILPIVISRSHDQGAMLKTDVRLLSFKANKRFYLDPPISITAKLRNDGNVHQNFDGAMEIWQGKVRLDRVPFKNTLMPEWTSPLEAHFEQPPYPGRMSAKLTGSVFLAKNNQEKKIAASSEFWYIPRVFAYVAAALLLFIAILSGFIVRRLLTRRRAKQEPADAEPLESRSRTF